MNYSEMSDFEINKAVAIALGHKCYYDNGSFTNGLMGSSVVVKGNGTIGSVNFVSSWADAGPIIQENKISLIHDCMAEPQDGGCWLARPTYGYEHEKSRSDNPLRAAMVLFLMMKEADNGSFIEL